MADSPFMKKLRHQARDLGGRAVSGMLRGGGADGALGAALQGAQAGRKVLDESASKVLDSLGLATRDDLERISQRIGRIRKRLRGLLDELDHDSVYGTEQSNRADPAAGSMKTRRLRET